MWDEIIHPFSNFNCATIDIWEWTSNFISHFPGHVITHLFMLEFELIHISKRGIEAMYNTSLYLYYL